MTPGHCYLRGDAGAGCHQQLCSPNTQEIILPEESHVHGITAPPASLQGRKAGREASCCPATSQREQEVEEKDPVWIQCSETHGETTISSKLCICWSSAAALTSRGCALLDPYVILCNPCQDPIVGFVGPPQEKAPELKRFPGSYNQAASSFLPQVFLPAETSLSFPPLSHLPGGDLLALVVFPTVHGFKLCIPIHPASSLCLEKSMPRCALSPHSFPLLFTFMSALPTFFLLVTVPFSH